MDEKFILSRKRDLLKEKNALARELKQIAQKKGGKYKTIFPELGRSEDESAEEFRLYEESINLEKNLELKLRAVEKALKKITKGTYGKCEICGKFIHPNRLEAFPEAATCLKCQSKRGT